MNTISTKIKKHIREKKISQAAFARKIGIHPSFLCLALQGRKRLSLRYLRELKRLGLITYNDLIKYVLE